MVRFIMLTSGAGNSSDQINKYAIPPKCKIRYASLEMMGIEPTTFSMQMRRSATDLHPHIVRYGETLRISSLCAYWTEGSQLVHTDYDYSTVPLRTVVLRS